jgi:hypothetical protein
MDGYVAKPVNRQELFAVIKSMHGKIREFRKHALDQQNEASAMEASRQAGLMPEQRDSDRP